MHSTISVLTENFAIWWSPSPKSSHVERIGTSMMAPFLSFGNTNSLSMPC